MTSETIISTREPARHVLKTWPAPFHALCAGVKTFEFRKDDRGFEVGDMLVLDEWVPLSDHPDGGYETGHATIRWVTYILRGPAFGLPEGYCVMSVSERRPT